MSFSAKLKKRGKKPPTDDNDGGDHTTTTHLGDNQTSSDILHATRGYFDSKEQDRRRRYLEFAERTATFSVSAPDITSKGKYTYEGDVVDDEDDVNEGSSSNRNPPVTSSLGGIVVTSPSSSSSAILSTSTIPTKGHKQGNNNKNQREAPTYARPNEFLVLNEEQKRILKQTALRYRHTNNNNYSSSPQQQEGDASTTVDSGARTSEGPGPDGSSGDLIIAQNLVSRVPTATSSSTDQQPEKKGGAASSSSSAVFYPIPLRSKHALPDSENARRLSPNNNNNDSSTDGHFSPKSRGALVNSSSSGQPDFGDLKGAALIEAVSRHVKGHFDDHDSIDDQRQMRQQQEELRKSEKRRKNAESNNSSPQKDDDSPSSSSSQHQQQPQQQKELPPPHGQTGFLNPNKLPFLKTRAMELARDEQMAYHVRQREALEEKEDTRRQETLATQDRQRMEAVVQWLRTFPPGSYMLMLSIQQQCFPSAMAQKMPQTRRGVGFSSGGGGGGTSPASAMATRVPSSAPNRSRVVGFGEQVAPTPTSQSSGGARSASGPFARKSVVVLSGDQLTSPRTGGGGGAKKSSHKKKRSSDAPSHNAKDLDGTSPSSSAQTPQNQQRRSSISRKEVEAFFASVRIAGEDNNNNNNRSIIADDALDQDFGEGGRGGDTAITITEQSSSFRPFGDEQPSAYGDSGGVYNAGSSAGGLPNSIEDSCNSIMPPMRAPINQSPPPKYVLESLAATGLHLVGDNEGEYQETRERKRNEQEVSSTTKHQQHPTTPSTSNAGGIPAPPARSTHIGTASEVRSVMARLTGVQHDDTPQRDTSPHNTPSKLPRLASSNLQFPSAGDHLGSSFAHSVLSDLTPPASGLEVAAFPPVLPNNRRRMTATSSHFPGSDAGELGSKNGGELPSGHYGRSYSVSTAVPPVIGTLPTMSSGPAAEAHAAVSSAAYRRQSMATTVGPMSSITATTSSSHRKTKPHRRRTHHTAASTSTGTSLEDNDDDEESSDVSDSQFASGRSSTIRGAPSTQVDGSESEDASDMDDTPLRPGGGKRAAAKRSHSLVVEGAEEAPEDEVSRSRRVSTTSHAKSAFSIATGASTQKPPSTKLSSGSASKSDNRKKQLQLKETTLMKLEKQHLDADNVSSLGGGGAGNTLPIRSPLLPQHSQNPNQPTSPQHRIPAPSTKHIPVTAGTTAATKKAGAGVGGGKGGRMFMNSKGGASSASAKVQQLSPETIAKERQSIADSRSQMLTKAVLIDEIQSRFMCNWFSVSPALSESYHALQRSLQHSNNSVSNSPRGRPTSGSTGRPGSSQPRPSSKSRPSAGRVGGDPFHSTPSVTDTVDAPVPLTALLPPDNHVVSSSDVVKQRCIPSIPYQDPPPLPPITYNKPHRSNNTRSTPTVVVDDWDISSVAGATDGGYDNPKGTLAGGGVASRHTPLVAEHGKHLSSAKLVATASAASMSTVAPGMSRALNAQQQQLSGTQQQQHQGGAGRLPSNAAAVFRVSSAGGNSHGDGSGIHTLGDSNKPSSRRNLLDAKNASHRAIEGLLGVSVYGIQHQIPTVTTAATLANNTSNTTNIHNNKNTSMYVLTEEQRRTQQVLSEGIVLEPTQASLQVVIRSNVLTSLEHGTTMHAQRGGAAPRGRSPPNSSKTTIPSNSLLTMQCVRSTHYEEILGLQTAPSSSSTTSYYGIKSCSKAVTPSTTTTGDTGLVSDDNSTATRIPPSHIAANANRRRVRHTVFPPPGSEDLLILSALSPSALSSQLMPRITPPTQDSSFNLQNYHPTPKVVVCPPSDTRFASLGYLDPLKKRLLVCIAQQAALRRIGAREGDILTYKNHITFRPPYLLTSTSAPSPSHSQRHSSPPRRQRQVTGLDDRGALSPMSTKAKEKHFFPSKASGLTPAEISSITSIGGDVVVVEQHQTSQNKSIATPSSSPSPHLDISGMSGVRRGSGVGLESHHSATTAIPPPPHQDTVFVGPFTALHIARDDVSRRLAENNNMSSQTKKIPIAATSVPPSGISVSAVLEAATDTYELNFQAVRKHLAALRKQSNEEVGALWSSITALHNQLRAEQDRKMVPEDDDDTLKPNASGQDTYYKSNGLLGAGGNTSMSNPPSRKGTSRSLNRQQSHSNSAFGRQKSNLVGSSRFSSTSKHADSPTSQRDPRRAGGGDHSGLNDDNPAEITDFVPSIAVPSILCLRDLGAYIPALKSYSTLYALQRLCLVKDDVSAVECSQRREITSSLNDLTSLVTAAVNRSSGSSGAGASGAGTNPRSATASPKRASTTAKSPSSISNSSPLRVGHHHDVDPTKTAATTTTNQVVPSSVDSDVPWDASERRHWGYSHPWKIDTDASLLYRSPTFPFPESSVSAVSMLLTLSSLPLLMLGLRVHDSQLASVLGSTASRRLHNEATIQQFLPSTAGNKGAHDDGSGGGSVYSFHVPATAVAEQGHGALRRLAACLRGREDPDTMVRLVESLGNIDSLDIAAIELYGGGGIGGSGQSDAVGPLTVGDQRMAALVRRAEATMEGNNTDASEKPIGSSSNQQHGTGSAHGSITGVVGGGGGRYSRDAPHRASQAASELILDSDAFAGDTYNWMFLRGAIKEERLQNVLLKVLSSRAELRRLKVLASDPSHHGFSGVVEESIEYVLATNADVANASRLETFLKSSEVNLLYIMSHSSLPGSWIAASRFGGGPAQTGSANTYNASSSVSHGAAVVEQLPSFKMALIKAHSASLMSGFPEVYYPHADDSNMGAIARSTLAGRMPSSSSTVVPAAGVSPTTTPAAGDHHLNDTIATPRESSVVKGGDGMLHASGLGVSASSSRRPRSGSLMVSAADGASPLVSDASVNQRGLRRNSSNPATGGESTLQQTRQYLSLVNLMSSPRTQDPDASLHQQFDSVPSEPPACPSIPSSAVTLPALSGMLPFPVSPFSPIAPVLCALMLSLERSIRSLRQQYELLLRSAELRLKLEKEVHSCDTELADIVALADIESAKSDLSSTSSSYHKKKSHQALKDIKSAFTKDGAFSLDKFMGTSSGVTSASSAAAHATTTTSPKNDKDAVRRRLASLLSETTFRRYEEVATLKTRLLEASTLVGTGQERIAERIVECEESIGHNEIAIAAAAATYASVSALTVPLQVCPPPGGRRNNNNSNKNVSSPLLSAKPSFVKSSTMSPRVGGGGAFSPAPQGLSLFPLIPECQISVTADDGPSSSPPSGHISRTQSFSMSNHLSSTSPNYTHAKSTIDYFGMSRNAASTGGDALDEDGQQQQQHQSPKPRAWTVNQVLLPFSRTYCIPSSVGGVEGTGSAPGSRPGTSSQPTNKTLPPSHTVANRASKSSTVTSPLKLMGATAGHHHPLAQDASTAFRGSTTTTALQQMVLSYQSKSGTQTAQEEEENAAALNELREQEDRVSKLAQSNREESRQINSAVLLCARDSVDSGGMYAFKVNTSAELPLVNVAGDVNVTRSQHHQHHTSSSMAEVKTSEEADHAAFMENFVTLPRVRPNYLFAWRVAALVLRVVAVKFMPVLRRVREERRVANERPLAAFIIQCMMRRRWQRIRTEQRWAVRCIERWIRPILQKSLALKATAARCVQRSMRTFLRRVRGRQKVRESLNVLRREVIRSRVQCLVARKQLRQLQSLKEERLILTHRCSLFTHKILTAERTEWRRLAKQAKRAFYNGLLEVLVRELERSRITSLILNDVSIFGRFQQISAPLHAGGGGAFSNTNILNQSGGGGGSGANTKKTSIVSISSTSGGTRAGPSPMVAYLNNVGSRRISLEQSVKNMSRNSSLPDTVGEPMNMWVGVNANPMLGSLLDVGGSARLSINESHDANALSNLSAVPTEEHWVPEDDVQYLLDAICNDDDLAVLYKGAYASFVTLSQDINVSTIDPSSSTVFDCPTLALASVIHEALSIRMAMAKSNSSGQQSGAGVSRTQSNANMIPESNNPFSWVQSETPIQLSFSSHKMAGVSPSNMEGSNPLTFLHATTKDSSQNRGSGSNVSRVLSDDRSTVAGSIHSYFCDSSSPEASGGVLPAADGADSITLKGEGWLQSKTFASQRNQAHKLLQSLGVDLEQRASLPALKRRVEMLTGFHRFCLLSLALCAVSPSVPRSTSTTTTVATPATKQSTMTTYTPTSFQRQAEKLIKIMMAISSGRSYSRCAEISHDDEHALPNNNGVLREVRDWLVWKKNSKTVATDEDNVTATPLPLLRPTPLPHTPATQPSAAGGDDDVCSLLNTFNEAMLTDAPPNSTTTTAYQASSSVGGAPPPKSSNAAYEPFVLTAVQQLFCGHARLPRFQSVLVDLPSRYNSLNNNDGVDGDVDDTDDPLSDRNGGLFSLDASFAMGQTMGSTNAGGVVSPASNGLPKYPITNALLSFAAGGGGTERKSTTAIHNNTSTGITTSDSLINVTDTAFYVRTLFFGNLKTQDENYGELRRKAKAVACKMREFRDRQRALLEENIQMLDNNNNGGCKNSNIADIVTVCSSDSFENDAKEILGDDLSNHTTSSSTHPEFPDRMGRVGGGVSSSIVLPHRREGETSRHRLGRRGLVTSMEDLSDEEGGGGRGVAKPMGARHQPRHNAATSTITTAASSEAVLSSSSALDTFVPTLSLLCFDAVPNDPQRRYLRETEHTIVRSTLLESATTVSNCGVVITTSKNNEVGGVAVLASDKNSNTTNDATISSEMVHGDGSPLLTFKRGSHGARGGKHAPQVAAVRSFPDDDRDDLCIVQYLLQGKQYIDPFDAIHQATSLGEDPTLSTSSNTSISTTPGLGDDNDEAIIASGEWAPLSTLPRVSTASPKVWGDAAAASDSPMHRRKARRNDSNVTSFGDESDDAGGRMGRRTSQGNHSSAQSHSAYYRFRPVAKASTVGWRPDDYDAVVRHPLTAWDTTSYPYATPTTSMGRYLLQQLECVRECETEEGSAVGVVNKVGVYDEKEMEEGSPLNLDGTAMSDYGGGGAIPRHRSSSQIPTTHCDSSSNFSGMQSLHRSAIAPSFKSMSSSLSPKEKDEALRTILQSASSALPLPAKRGLSQYIRRFRLRHLYSLIKLYPQLFFSEHFFGSSGGTSQTNGCGVQEFSIQDSLDTCVQQTALSQQPIRLICPLFVAVTEGGDEILGQRPSNAHFYLSKPAEVATLLTAVSAAAHAQEKMERMHIYQPDALGSASADISDGISSTSVLPSAADVHDRGFTNRLSEWASLSASSSHPNLQSGDTATPSIFPSAVGEAAVTIPSKHNLRVLKRVVLLNASDAAATAARRNSVGVFGGTLRGESPTMMMMPQPASRQQSIVSIDSRKGGKRRNRSSIHSFVENAADAGHNNTTAPINVGSELHPAHAVTDYLNVLSIFKPPPTPTSVWPSQHQQQRHHHRASSLVSGDIVAAAAVSSDSDFESDYSAVSVEGESKKARSYRGRMYHHMIGTAMTPSTPQHHPLNISNASFGSHQDKGAVGVAATDMWRRRVGAGGSHTRTGASITPVVRLDEGALLSTSGEMNSDSSSPLFAATPHSRRSVSRSSQVALNCGSSGWWMSGNAKEVDVRPPPTTTANIKPRGWSTLKSNIQRVVSSSGDHVLVGSGSSGVVEDGSPSSPGKATKVSFAQAFSTTFDSGSGGGNNVHHGLFQSLASGGGGGGDGSPSSNNKRNSSVDHSVSFNASPTNGMVLILNSLQELYGESNRRISNVLDASSSELQHGLQHVDDDQKYSAFTNVPAVVFGCVRVVREGFTLGFDLKYHQHTDLLRRGATQPNMAQISAFVFGSVKPPSIALPSPGRPQSPQQDGVAGGGGDGDILKASMSVSPAALSFTQLQQHQLPKLGGGGDAVPTSTAYQRNPFTTSSLPTPDEVLLPFSTIGVVSAGLCMQQLNMIQAASEATHDIAESSHAVPPAQILAALMRLVVSSDAPGWYPRTGLGYVSTSTDFSTNEATTTNNIAASRIPMLSLNNKTATVSGLEPQLLGGADLTVPDGMYNIHRELIDATELTYTTLLKALNSNGSLSTTTTTNTGSGADGVAVEGSTTVAEGTYTALLRILVDADDFAHDFFSCWDNKEDGLWSIQETLEKVTLPLNPPTDHQPQPVVEVCSLVVSPPEVGAATTASSPDVVQAGAIVPLGRRARAPSHRKKPGTAPRSHPDQPRQPYRSHQERMATLASHNAMLLSGGGAVVSQHGFTTAPLPKRRVGTRRQTATTASTTTTTKVLPIMLNRPLSASPNSSWYTVFSGLGRVVHGLTAPEKEERYGKLLDAWKAAKAKAQQRSQRKLPGGGDFGFGGQEAMFDDEPPYPKYPFAYDFTPITVASLDYVRARFSLAVGDTAFLPLTERRRIELGEFGGDVTMKSFMGNIQRVKSNNAGLRRLKSHSKLPLDQQLQHQASTSVAASSSSRPPSSGARLLRPNHQHMHLLSGLEISVAQSVDELNTTSTSSHLLASMLGGPAHSNSTTTRGSTGTKRGGLGTSPTSIHLGDIPTGGDAFESGVVKPLTSQPPPLQVESPEVSSGELLVNAALEDAAQRDADIMAQEDLFTHEYTKLLETSERIARKEAEREIDMALKDMREYVSWHMAVVFLQELTATIVVGDDFDDAEEFERRKGAEQVESVLSAAELAERRAPGNAIVSKSSAARPHPNYPSTTASGADISSPMSPKKFSINSDSSSDALGAGALASSPLTNNRLLSPPGLLSSAEDAERSKKVKLLVSAGTTVVQAEAAVAGGQVLLTDNHTKLKLLRLIPRQRGPFHVLTTKSASGIHPIFAEGVLGSLRPMWVLKIGYELLVEEANHRRAIVAEYESTPLIHLNRPVRPQRRALGGGSKMNAAGGHTVGWLDDMGSSFKGGGRQSLSGGLSMPSSLDRQSGRGSSMGGLQEGSTNSPHRYVPTLPRRRGPTQDADDADDIPRRSGQVLQEIVLLKEQQAKKVLPRRRTVQVYTGAEAFPVQPNSSSSSHMVHSSHYGGDGSTSGADSCDSPIAIPVEHDPFEAFEQSNPDGRGNNNNELRASGNRFRSASLDTFIRNQQRSSRPSVANSAIGGATNGTGVDGGDSSPSTPNTPASLVSGDTIGGGGAPVEDRPSAGLPSNAAYRRQSALSDCSATAIPDVTQFRRATQQFTDVLPGFREPLPGTSETDEGEFDSTDEDEDEDPVAPPLMPHIRAASENNYVTDASPVTAATTRYSLSSRLSLSGNAHHPFASLVMQQQQSSQNADASGGGSTPGSGSVSPLHTPPASPMNRADNNSRTLSMSDMMYSNTNTTTTSCGVDGGHYGSSSSSQQTLSRDGATAAKKALFSSKLGTTSPERSSSTPVGIGAGSGGGGRKQSVQHTLPSSPPPLTENPRIPSTRGRRMTAAEADLLFPVFMPGDSETVLQQRRGEGTEWRSAAPSSYFNDADRTSYSGGRVNSEVGHHHSQDNDSGHASRTNTTEASSPIPYGIPRHGSGSSPHPNDLHPLQVRSPHSSPHRRNAPRGSTDSISPRGSMDTLSGGGHRRSTASSASSIAAGHTPPRLSLSSLNGAALSVATAASSAIQHYPAPPNILGREYVHQPNRNPRRSLRVTVRTSPSASSSRRSPRQ